MNVGKLHLRAAAKHAWLLLVALVACTDLAERPSPVKISIDADGIVRLDTVRVEISIEGLVDEQKKTWEPLPDHVFKPDPMVDTDWPWQHTLDAKLSSYARYNLTAIARDPQGSVVGRVQIVRDLADARRSGLRARFDAACHRPAMPCGEGDTCTGGKCVDAAGRAASPAADGGTDEPAEQDPKVATPATDGTGSEGMGCKEGSRACVDQGSRTPLACEGGVWHMQPECGPNERCNTANTAERGMCKPIAEECVNRQPDVPYCDGETMRICVDLLVSDVRACSENERCVPDAPKARCACRPGFVMDGTRCVRATECGRNGGGCDPLTLCSMVNGQPACSPCPRGYSGTGERGCAPLLQSLKLSAGELEPAFDPDVHEYQVEVPLLAQTATLTPTMPAKTMVTLAGATLEPNGSWISPVLALGKPSSIELVLTSEFGVSSKYTVALSRKGEQRSYVKPPKPGSYNQFGSAIDIEGDTLVVGSWFEDMGATDTGAAYVLVRDGDGWKQQAQLKPSDVAANDFFGTSAALDGDTIVIGAPHQGLFEAEATRQGAVYVYTRNAGNWSQTQRLAGTQQSKADFFGSALVLAGDTLVISAPWDATDELHSGAVYIYQRSGGMWTEVQKLKSSKPTANVKFGASLALDGDRLVVGAPDDPVPNTRPGSAEVFVRRAGTFRSVQFLQPMLGPGACFGGAVGLRGNYMAISAPRPSPYPGSPMPTSPGEVYVFEPDGELWKQTAVLHARIPRDTDWFGLSLKLSDAGLIVGAPGDTSGGRGVAADPARGDAIFSGAVYLFAPSKEGWVESAFIKGDNTAINDWFGFAVATDGQALLVSALFENGGGSGLTTGALYLFQ